MCDLCILEEKTEWFYEDDIFMVIQCETCHDKMIVLKFHQSQLDYYQSLRLLTLVEEFGADRTKVDFIRDRYPQHFYCHLR